MKMLLAQPTHTHTHHTTKQSHYKMSNNKFFLFKQISTNYLFGNGPPERRSPPCWLREDWWRLEMEDEGRVIWNFLRKRELL
jgi:hypothetical protein